MLEEQKYVSIFILYRIKSFFSNDHHIDFPSICDISCPSVNVGKGYLLLDFVFISYQNGRVHKEGVM